MNPSNSVVLVARQCANRYAIDPGLVCAVIEQESAWNPWAVRYEPEFEMRYVRALELDPTLTKLRSISWGLMQVMGQVAREFGFTGELPSLCSPMNGVEIGCKVLAHKIAVNEGNVRAGLLAWNGGANPQYADEVLARIGVYA